MYMKPALSPRGAPFVTLCLWSYLSVWDTWCVLYQFSSCTLFNVRLPLKGFDHLTHSRRTARSRVRAAPRRRVGWAGLPLQMGIIQNGRDRPYSIGDDVAVNSDIRRMGSDWLFCNSSDTLWLCAVCHHSRPHRRLWTIHGVLDMYILHFPR